MYVELDLPDINVDYQVFGRFWLKTLFGPGLPHDRQVATLASTFVRLVQSAIRNYQLGVANTREYWGTHSSIALGAMHQATSYFEACVSDMHRAVNCFTRLRRHKNLGLLSSINSQRPKFVSARVHDQLRDARNEIHHMEEMVMDDKLIQGQSAALRADGPEVAHPTEADQTIKTINCLTVGSCRIAISDIAEWLSEMAKFCELMSL